MRLIIPKRRPRGGFQIAPARRGCSGQQIMSAAARASGLEMKDLLVISNSRAKGSYPRCHWQSALATVLWNECPHLSGERISQLFGIDRSTLFAKLATVRKSPMLFAYCANRIYEVMEEENERAAKTAVRGALGRGARGDQKVDEEPDFAPN